MRYHHTKNKGDLGAIKAMADMTAKGWSVFVGLSEHQAFDFAAYRDGRFLRVQAKYRAVDNGKVILRLDTNWTDRNGTHHVPLDREALDVIAIYVPDSDCCYYVDPRAESGETICLRFTPCLNNNKKRIRWATDYVEIPSTVRGISAGEASGLVGWGWVRQSAGSRAA
jgi:hypothetical protein